MTLFVGKFVRRELWTAYAVKVTSENINEVTIWCKGRRFDSYIRVNHENTARIGDWVMKDNDELGNDFIVYSDNEFDSTFKAW